MHGFDLPKLTKALLFVALEQDAPGAARFANGDWSEVDIVMPSVTRLVGAIGWSPFVMQTFLTLCERAGPAYPLNAFAVQVNAILGRSPMQGAVGPGALRPARPRRSNDLLMNFPLRVDQAQGLLRVLDGLIDLGDRRSAALEQTEAFKGIQGPLHRREVKAVPRNNQFDAIHLKPGRNGDCRRIVSEA